MKRNKGFTLIELLAVIVILAIIALIATPIVLNIIKDSKDSATLQSAEFYLGAVETAVAKKIIDDPTFKPKSCEIQKDGNLKCGETYVKVEINGEKPTSGTIILENGEIEDVELVLNEKTVVKNSEGKLEYSVDSATLQSAKFYLGAVETAVAKKIMDDPTFKPTSCEIQKDGNLKCGETDVKVEINGEKPTSGTIILKSGEIEDVELVLNEKTVVKNSEGKLEYSVSLQSGLYDEGGNLIATWDELVKSGIDLEKDVEPQVNENGEIINLSEIPGAILSNDEKLSKGTKLVIDSSVKKIGSTVFAMNTTLKEVIMTNNVNEIKTYAFAMMGALESITLSKNITTINPMTFYFNVSLKNIIIPDSVTSIGSQAFDSCISLEKIILPKNITSIGSQAFARGGLKSIIIPDGITTIESSLFEESELLESVTIPKSVTSIGDYAFGKTNLKTINYVGTQDEWNAISFGSSWCNGTPADKVINYNYVIPQN